VRGRVSPRANIRQVLRVLTKIYERRARSCRFIFISRLNKTRENSSWRSFGQRGIRMFAEMRESELHSRKPFRSDSSFIVRR